LISSIVGGLIVGITGVLFTLSFASLVFTQSLTPYLPAGVGIALLSSLICRLGVRFLSSNPLIIADIDTLPAALMGASASNIATQLATTTPLESIFLTIVITLALLTLVTGFALFLLGHFKIGDWVRYLPWPVFAGFLAATGWLFMQAGFSVSLDQPLNLHNALTLLQPDRFLHWFPGMALGAILALISIRDWPDWLLSVIICGLIGMFHLGLNITDISIAKAIEQGWLLGNFPVGQFWQPWHIQGLPQMHWSVLPSQVGVTLSMVVINAVAILLNTTALEQLFQQELDLNRELKAAGITNMLVGLSGGWVGNHALGDTSLAYRIGGGNPWTNMIALSVFVFTLALGSASLSLFPKFIVAGLLFYLGLTRLKDWLYDSWFKLPKADYAIIILMVLSITQLGLLPGMGVGLAVAIAQFLYQLSQISSIKYSLNGAQKPSKTARSQPQRQWLDTAATQILILELQGFFFFGTAHQLFKHLQTSVFIDLSTAASSTNLASEPSATSVRFILLNFRHVKGLDATAINSFNKLAQLAHHHQVTLGLSELSPSMQKQLQYQLSLIPVDPSPPAPTQLNTTQQAFLYFTSLDTGIAWCEDQLLAEVPWRRSRNLPLALQLEKQLPADCVATLMAALEAQDIDTGTTLFEQGSPAHQLFWIESGQVSTFFTPAHGDPHRITSIGPGHLLGDIDFYRENIYSATAIADQPTTVYSLSQANWQQIEQTHPQTAYALKSMILKRVSHQLTQAYSEVIHLMQ
jgi:sulfate permease, SulP family